MKHPEGVIQDGTDKFRRHQGRCAASQIDGIENKVLDIMLAAVKLHLLFKGLKISFNDQVFGPEGNKAAVIAFFPAEGDMNI